MILIVRDSTVLKAQTDTVYVERWRLEVRERIHRDTVRIAVRDTVRVESVRVENGKVESGKRASKWWIWPVAIVAGIGIYTVFKRK